MTQPIPPDVTAWIDEEGWLLISEEKPGEKARYVRISPYHMKVLGFLIVGHELEMDEDLANEPQPLDARFGALDEEGGYEEGAE